MKVVCAVVVFSVCNVCPKLGVRERRRVAKLAVFARAPETGQLAKLR